MSAVIVDLPGDVVSTSYGPLLLVKVLGVTAAAIVGAYNHRIVIPELIEYSADPYASERLRLTVRVEA
ncbi:MAG: CopD family protein [Actinobacteria bacterium]|nr:CopD family protein [Actinomycetota bacterium]